MLHVLTNLDSQLYSADDIIVDFDQKLDSLLFIESGQCDLIGRINSRNEKFEVKIVRLFERSWYGDFQVFNDLESKLKLKAVKDKKSLQNEAAQARFHGFVHILKLNGEDLKDLCYRYPIFSRFLVQRATYRRTYFIKVLHEFEHEVELQLKEE